MSSVNSLSLPVEFVAQALQFRVSGLPVPFASVRSDWACLCREMNLPCKTQYVILGIVRIAKHNARGHVATMKTDNKTRQTGCPVAFGLDMFGDRWTLLIIREIMLRGKKTYSQFLEMEEGIATNILVDRLKHLEAADIVIKSRDPENRRSFTYTLTQKGRDLAPIILEIIIWSGNYDDRPLAMREMFDKIQSGRDVLQKNLMSGLPQA